MKGLEAGLVFLGKKGMEVTYLACQRVKGTKYLGISMYWSPQILRMTCL